MTPSRGAPGGGDGGVPKHAGAAPGAGPAAAVPTPGRRGRGGCC